MKLSTRLEQPKLKVFPDMQGRGKVMSVLGTEQSKFGGQVIGH